MHLNIFLIFVIFYDIFIFSAHNRNEI